MRFHRKASLFTLVLFLLLGLSMSSCRLLRGDPRKNCNHPEHGLYMKERQQKQFNGTKK